MSEFGVVLFHTSSAAMRAEKIMGAAGLNVRLIPTPRELSSDCGISMRFSYELREIISSLLEESGVETAGIHLLP